MNRETVCVTGGLGYVGSRLLPDLLRRGHGVTALDLALYGEAGLRHLEAQPEWKDDWSRRFRHVKGDLRDPAAVQDALESATAVVHLAAISNDPTAEVDEVLTRQVNFDAVGLLLASSRRAGVRRFVNASSSSVFGIKEEEEIVEALEPEPLSAYSRMKALSEWLVLSANSAELCAVNVRPATICGTSPRQRFDLTVNKLTADALQKGVITVHGGQQRRPNVWIQDACDLYCHLLQEDAKTIAGQTFNFGFENLKVIEIAELIKGELSDRDVEIRVADVFDARDYHISSKKLLERLSYTPKGSIRHAVSEVRAALEAGVYGDVDDPLYHNMKSMKLERRPDAYTFMAF